MSDESIERAFATLQVQEGYDAGALHRAALPPIYQSNAFEFASLGEAADLFALRRSGDIYSRNNNPTVAVLEQRVARLEGGTAAVAVGSGQAAMAGALLALARAGDHIVAADGMYGGTVDLLADTFADLGIETTFVAPDDLDAWRAAARPHTRAFVAESLSNPLARVLDTRAVADAAHAAGVPLVVDNTIASPYLQRPGEHGADIVVHSATKYLGGHGAVLGGIVVDMGRFDFGADAARWPQFTGPYQRFGDVVLWDRYGAHGQALTVLLKTKYVHDFGPTLSATSAAQLLHGIETLDLRMRRHADSALEVARFLDAHPAVARVHHPGLADDPHNERAAHYLPRGASGVFSFELAGDDATAFARIAAVIDRLRVVRLVANIGDARSLIAHPASMTHSHLSADALAAGGITLRTVRLSIGLEDVADITGDLGAALDAGYPA